MTVDLTRRGFLKGLAGTAVIAVLPKVPLAPAQPAIAEAVPPPATLTPPHGMTYNWVRTSLMGEPDIENLEDRISNGWTFVRPSAHPDMPVEDAAIAFERRGLILMECPTVDCALRNALEQFRERDRLPPGAISRIVPLGYVVLPNGDIVDLHGRPFNGTVSAEHLAIAAKWKQKAERGTA